MRVKQIAFNPLWGGLQYILDSSAEDGWALSHVVPVNDYQSVLVFMRPESTPEAEGREVDEDGSYL